MAGANPRKLMDAPGVSGSFGRFRERFGDDFGATLRVKSQVLRPISERHIHGYPPGFCRAEIAYLSLKQDRRGPPRPTDINLFFFASDFKGANVVVKNPESCWGPKVTWAARSTDFHLDLFGTKARLKSIDWGGSRFGLL